MKHGTNAAGPGPWSPAGLWARLVLVGVIATATGVALLVATRSNFVPALAFAAGGAWLARLGWCGLREALRAADGPSPRDGAPAVPRVATATPRAAT